MAPVVALPFTMATYAPCPFAMHVALLPAVGDSLGVPLPQPPLPPPAAGVGVRKAGADRIVGKAVKAPWSRQEDILIRDGVLQLAAGASMLDRLVMAGQHLLRQGPHRGGGGVHVLGLHVGAAHPCP